MKQFRAQFKANIVELEEYQVDIDPKIQRRWMLKGVSAAVIRQAKALPDYHSMTNDVLFGHLEAIDESISATGGSLRSLQADTKTVQKQVKKALASEMESLNFVKKSGKWVPRDKKEDNKKPRVEINSANGQKIPQFMKPAVC